MSERYLVGTVLAATHIDRTITIVEYVGINSEGRHRYRATRNDDAAYESYFYTENYLKRCYMEVDPVEKVRKIGKYKVTRR